LSVEDICNYFPNEYYLNKKESNFSNCPKLYKDIDTINQSTEVDKWITKNNNKIKLATKEECERDIQRLKKRLSKAGKEIYRLEKKMKLDGQCKLLSNQNKPIDEKSKARNYVETYANK